MYQYFIFFRRPKEGDELICHLAKEMSTTGCLRLTAFKENIERTNEQIVPIKTSTCFYWAAD